MANHLFHIAQPFMLKTLHQKKKKEQLLKSPTPTNALNIKKQAPHSLKTITKNSEQTHRTLIIHNPSRPKKLLLIPLNPIQVKKQNKDKINLRMPDNKHEPNEFKTPTKK